MDGFGFDRRLGAAPREPAFAEMIAVLVGQAGRLPDPDDFATVARRWADRADALDDLAPFGLTHDPDGPPEADPPPDAAVPAADTHDDGEPVDDEHAGCPKLNRAQRRHRQRRAWSPR